MHGKFKTRFLAPVSHLLKGVGASALSLLIGSTLLDHTAQPGVASGAREARPALPANAHKLLSISSFGRGMGATTMRP